MPSGISAAMTATSASSHKQYFTKIGYSALHNSDRCFPEGKKKHTNFYIFLHLCFIKQSITVFKRFLCHVNPILLLGNEKRNRRIDSYIILPVLTPKFAARD